MQKRKKVKRKCTEKIRLQNFLLQKYTRGKSFAGEREKGNVIQQKCKKCESHTYAHIQASSQRRIFSFVDCSRSRKCCCQSGQGGNLLNCFRDGTRHLHCDVPKQERPDTIAGCYGSTKHLWCVVDTCVEF